MSPDLDADDALVGSIATVREAKNCSSRVPVRYPPLAGAFELKGNRVAENEVVWWEIESPDPDRTQGFYSALFGWGFRRAFDEPNSELGRRYWIVERGGAGIGGLHESVPAASAAHAGVRLYVEVDDLEATLSRAVELGATSERGRTFLGTDDFWFANVRDPTGISLGLWTSRPPPN